MSVESPSLLPVTALAIDSATILPSSQHCLSSTITAHARSSSGSTVPTVMRATSMTANSVVQLSANEPPPVRSPMSPGTPNGDLDSPTCQTPEVDAQILEALKSKDRLYVLKLGEVMETLITERRPRIELSPSTSYQRLLVHRCSAYYKLAPESEHGNKGIAVLLTPDSRIPARRLRELIPAETTAQPAIKIMRRNVQDRFRNKPQSQAGSVTGEEADLSDIEPSESGSVGSRSNATGGSSSKKRMTIEEREAAYNEARSRIFMDFDEKEKGKDMNASSSSLSLASGSASTSSGLDDFDDSVSSPTTESEWSGSVNRDKKDVRLALGSASSLRSLRSSAPPFNTDGSNSSRGSRASSPSSFTYASLYEPPSSVPYDASHMPGQVPGTGFPAPYMYPYPPPGQAPHPPYIAPYPLFVPYPYPPNILPTAEHPHPPGNMYSQVHHAGYDHTNAWSHPQQPPAPVPHQPPSQPQPTNTTGAPLSQSAPPFQPTYMAYLPYPVPGYYPPPPPPPYAEQHIRQPHPHMHTPPMFTGEPPRHMNGNASNSSRGTLTNGNGTGNSSRASSRNSSGSGINGGPKRTGPSVVRTGWSFSPVANSNLTYGGSGPMSGASVCGSGGGGDVTVGPRFGANVRRSSGTSINSTGNKASPCDEASSNASSSTTSSSSRRTYTSTNSSQHPLPPRPDWAVGLKPQPTLHTPHPRHHNSPGAEWSAMKTSSILQPPNGNNNNSRNISPAKNGNEILLSRQLDAPQMSSALLQSTDFPPLTSVTTPPEKRIPTVTGVWTNMSSTRSVLMPSLGHVNSTGNALMHPGAGGSGTVNVDEQGGYERPPPRGNVELFNPKIVRRPNIVFGKTGPQQVEQDKDVARGEAVASAILVGQVISLTQDEPCRDGNGDERDNGMMPSA